MICFCAWAAWGWCLGILQVSQDPFLWSITVVVAAQKHTWVPWHFPPRLASPVSLPPEPLPVSSRPRVKLPSLARPLNPCLRGPVRRWQWCRWEGGSRRADVRVKRKLENKQRGGGNAPALEVQRHPPPHWNGLIFKKEPLRWYKKEQTSHTLSSLPGDPICPEVPVISVRPLYLATRLSSLRQLFCQDGDLPTSSLSPSAMASEKTGGVSDVPGER